MTRVVLASASPRRRELLAALIDDFEVAPADILEDPGTDPREGALRLAREKAAVVAHDVSPLACDGGRGAGGEGTTPGAVVIGSDTIVHDGARPYGKPADAADAVAMLQALRGHEHRVFTGVAVAMGGEATVALSESVVVLAALPDEALAAYVASGRPLDKAGAYAIQDEDVPTVDTFDGCYCGVMGLPLWALKGLLERAGVPCRRPDVTYPRCASCKERP